MLMVLELNVVLTVIIDGSLYDGGCERKLVAQGLI